MWAIVRGCVPAVRACVSGEWRMARVVKQGLQHDGGLSDGGLDQI